MRTLTPLQRILILLSFCTIFGLALGSVGDRDLNFRACLQYCKAKDCTNATVEYLRGPVVLRVLGLGWDCNGNCQYTCMWETVKIFEKRNSPVPQFYGKWPFIRMYGIQEPASVLASVLNLFVHVMGLLSFRRMVPGDAPLFWLWHGFSVVCVHGWFWSTVFHTRDTPFTELMDYFSAFSMVMFSFLAAIVRVFERVQCLQVFFASFAGAIFFFYHVHYLSFVHFDYGYNMKINIATGICSALVWLAWSGWKRETHPHVWKCYHFTILAVLFLLFEVLDFPPIRWTLDAHALWHFSTIFITPLWYSFLVDDCLVLAQEMREKNE